MPQQVVTELLIDADVSGADRFKQGMNEASDAAQKGTNSAASVSLAIAGVGVAAIGTLAALRSFVDYVGNQSQALVDMADHAKLAGISTREFQETLFAARAKGLTEKDFVSGLDKIGADLTAASRGVTEFSKLFEANGLSIKNANGELKTTKEAVADLAGLVQNASPGIQQAIARIAGVSASWVPFLKQGAEGIEEQKKAAAGLGIIIDDNMISKAAEFNAQWKTAVATWDLQFKASLASILPLLVQLATLASKIIEGVGNVAGFASRLTTPDDDKTSAQLKDQIADVARLEDIMTKFGEQSFRATNLKGALGLPEDADLKTVDAYIGKLNELYDIKQKIARVDIGGGTTVLPPSSEGGRDALQTEIDRIEKHIAVTKADVEAVGQSAAAQAGLRAEATLYAAAERARKTDLEQYAQQFFDLREKIEAATQELNKAKVASDIKFAKDTIGLSPESVQIAQQLKNIYPDVATALQSTEAAQLRVIGLQNDLASGFTDVGKSITTAFLTGKNVMDAMVQSLDNIAKKLADKAFSNILEGILSGNPIQATIGVIQAGASAAISAFTGETKEKKALQEAQAAWAKMADQVVAFNRAAAGFNLGPLTQQIQQLSATEKTLMDAAIKAKDFAGAFQLGQTFNTGVTRIVDEFKRGAETLSPLQTAIKGVNDEYQGLYETLKSLHLDSLTIGLAESAQAQIKKLIAQFTDELNTSLSERLNTANGKTYLTDASKLLKQHATDLAAAGDLGNDPAVLAQINAVFHAEAQKIIEDAGLVGDSFNSFVAQFPELAGVVNQSSTALQNANDKFKALTDTINQYLDSLKLGSNSILSPQDQLGAAQDQFNRQLGLAQGGDQTALGSITQYASALLDQAKSFYASSSGYTDIYRAVTSELSGLTGGGPAAGFAAPSISAPLAISGVSSSIIPRVSVASSASNDNGQLFTQQTSTLVSAIGTAASAQIKTLQDQVDRLVAQNALLIAAVNGNKPQPRRPNDRAA